MVNERPLGQVSILNHGQYRFEYCWVLSERKGGREQWQLDITPKEGAVEPYDRARCELSFSPTTKTVLRGCELILKVRRRPLQLSLCLIALCVVVHTLEFSSSPDFEWPLLPHQAAGQWGGASSGLLLHRV